jgi:predicted component of type VI protein secretion system
MTDSVKAKLTENLEKAKIEGNLRSERIREIVRTAIAQSATELRAGSGELRSIVKEVLATVLTALGEKGQDAKEEITASIEGVVDGISQRQREAIAQSQSRLQQLQAEVDAQEQQLDAEIEGALVEIQSTGEDAPTDLKSMIDAAIKSVKEREEFALIQRQYEKLKTQLTALDERLATRYGDRYDEVKQYLNQAKVWYDNTKAEAEARGIDPLRQKQAELEEKFSRVGSTTARKEQQIKQQLRELWHTIIQR